MRAGWYLVLMTRRTLGGITLRKMAALLAVAALVAGGRTARAQEGTAMVRTTAGEVANQLRKDGVMVCFEEAAGQGEITARDAIAEIKALPEAERTAGEKARLFTLESMLQHTPEIAVRFPRLKKFAFNYVPPVKGPTAMLDALVAADPDYAWKQVGPRYIVYPRKGSPLDRPVAGFSVKAASYPVLLAALNKDVLAAWHVQCTGVFYSRDNAIKKKEYTFQLGATTGWTLLQTVADQLAPNLVWMEQSSGDSRTLYFAAVPHRNLHAWN